MRPMALCNYLPLKDILEAHRNFLNRREGRPLISAFFLNQDSN